MKSWTETVFHLDKTDRLIVCGHEEGCASLSIPGYMTEEGRGFTLYFVREHVGMLEELIAALKGESERERG